MSAIILLFKKISRTEMTRLSLIYIFLEGLFVQAVNYGLFPDNALYLIYAFFAVYIIADNRGVSMRLLLELFLALIIMTALQLPLTVPLSYIPNSILRNFIANTVILLLSLLLAKKLDLNALKDYMINNNRIIMYCTIDLGLVCICLMLITQFTKSFDLTVNILFVLLLMLITIIFLQWKKERDAHLRTAQFIQLQRVCDDSFDKLITDVRSKQHEFNNQITSLLSLHYTCSSYETLVAEQEKYCKQFVKENQFNSLLHHDANPMLTGFLYYKLSAMAQDNIRVTQHILPISSDDTERIMDLIEITGILLNNAMEARDTYGIAEHAVSVELFSAGDTLHIRVKNTCPYIPAEELKRLTKKGYSQKGENRGFGLYNVDKLVSKYKGSLLIGNEKSEDANWFTVQISIAGWH
ncbi:MAG: GHKL domain-containing protein [Lachnospiraceae bacterium]|nr:GHKL domain-containing protein [Lachnospiraceae bacterium]